MNKAYTLIIACLMSAIFLGQASFCQAQGTNTTQSLDTVFWNIRNPYYYYWDDNWADIYQMAGHYTQSFSRPAYEGRINARYCWVDTTLQVIGIAAVASSVPFESDAWIDDNTIEGRVPEYLQLYEATDSDFYMLAQGSWDVRYPQKIYNFHGNDGLNVEYDRYHKLYEVYFDKPQQVEDSFYVAITGNNNYRTPSERYPGYNVIAHPYTSHFFIKGMYSDSWDTAFRPKQPYIKYRYLYPEPYDQYTHQWQFDTLWHYEQTYDYLVIFPIFDTVTKLCSAPNGLHVQYCDTARVTLAWQNNEADSWQVAVGPWCVPPDSCTWYTADTLTLTLTDLDTATDYVAYVRSVCDTGNHSDWSFGIHLGLASAGYCAAAYGLGVYSPDSSAATISWGSDASANAWQVAVGPWCVPPDSCTIYTIEETSLTLTTLDTATDYVTYVRSVCDTDLYSAWSFGLQFRLGQDDTTSSGGGEGGETTGIRTHVDRYTRLMPNPTEGRVTVFSSFRIDHLELYDLSGRLLEQHSVRALSTTLDLSAHPQGTYLLRIVTPQGVSTKKLIKN